MGLSHLPERLDQEHLCFARFNGAHAEDGGRGVGNSEAPTGRDAVERGPIAIN